MNVEIIVETPFLAKAIIFSVQGILEVLLVFQRTQKRESIILHNNIITSFILYVIIHYPITSSVLAFQLLLNLITNSDSSCHHLTPCDNMLVI